jgi:hypothetical protein
MKGYYQRSPYLSSGGGGQVIGDGIFFSGPPFGFNPTKYHNHKAGPESRKNAKK